jgi:hypothetical protein
VDDAERAETYLRLRAEAELRRARPDIVASVREVRWAGEILLAAGVSEDETVSRIAAELEVALRIRSRTMPRRTTRLDWLLGYQRQSQPPPTPPHGGPARPLRVVPIGSTIGIRDQRAPCDLHLMTLVGTPAQAAITVALRMRWPADGSSMDLEITGAGIQHLPYEQLAAVDDLGTRYRLQFTGDTGDGGTGGGGTAVWYGLILLSPAPPPDARWLDLIADGTRPLIRLDLRPPVDAARPADAPAACVTAAWVTVEETADGWPGEHVLAAEAEGILASPWDAQGPAADPRLGDLIDVLADAGALAPDSATPGQLAALCQRLGVTGHGIRAAPAATLPARWASVLAQHDAARADPAALADPVALGGYREEVFAPLATLLPDIEGTRFVLAGLSSAAGESYLHVLASGLPERAGRYAYGWTSGFGWWLRDDAGGWHVASGHGAGPRPAGPTGAFALRLAPPLAARPETIEVVVTGPAARLRAIVPVRDGTRNGQGAEGGTLRT